MIQKKVFLQPVLFFLGGGSRAVDRLSNNLYVCWFICIAHHFKEQKSGGGFAADGADDIHCSGCALDGGADAWNALTAVNKACRQKLSGSCSSGAPLKRKLILDVR